MVFFSKICLYIYNCVTQNNPFYVIVCKHLSFRQVIPLIPKIANPSDNGYMRIACSIRNAQTFFKPLLGGYQKQEQTQHCFKLVLFITYHFISLPFLSTVAMLEVSTFCWRASTVLCSLVSVPSSSSTNLSPFCSLNLHHLRSQIFLIHSYLTWVLYQCEMKSMPDSGPHCERVGEI
jgi:hypothetical protein